MRYVPSLSRKQIESATKHTHAMWGDGRTLAEHTAYNLEQIARAGPDLLRYVGVVADDGELLASSKRFTLELHSLAGNHAVRTLGIGAVFVAESARRKGAATFMLSAMMEEARDLGFSAALLYSDIGVSFYVRLGFSAFLAAEHVAHVADLPREGAIGTRDVRDDDADAILGWYDKAFEGTPSAFVRPRRSVSWLRYLGWRNRVETRVFVDDGRDVGYVMSSHHRLEQDGEAVMWVDEWSAPGIAESRVLATLRTMAEARGRNRIASWLSSARPTPGFQSQTRAKAIPMIASLGDSWPNSIDVARAHFGSFDHF